VCVAGGRVACRQRPGSAPQAVERRARTYLARSPQRRGIPSARAVGRLLIGGRLGRSHGARMATVCIPLTAFEAASGSPSSREPGNVADLPSVPR
jgi:hypothetical protein